MTDIITLPVTNAKANFNSPSEFFQWLAKEAEASPEFFYNVVLGYAAEGHLPTVIDYHADGNTTITNALGFLEACKQDLWGQAARL